MRKHGGDGHRETCSSCPFIYLLLLLFSICEKKISLKKGDEGCD